MRASFGVAVLLCVACGPLTPIRPDGGSAGGGALMLTGGGSAGGEGGGVGGGSGGQGGGSAGGLSAGGAAGGATAGGSAGGGTAGGMTGGGSGRFTWASMSVVPAPSGGTPSAVTARPGEAYFTMAGKLYRSTGGAFNEVPGFTLSSIQDVHVTPMGKVLVVANDSTSLICTASDCSIGSNYTMQSSGNSSDTFDGLCGRGERVFAIANGSSRQAQLFEFNGTGWMKVSNDLGFTEPRKCVVGPSGEVYVLGPTFVVRYEGGAFGQENVSLMGQGNAEWFDLSLVFTGTQVRTGMLVGGIGNLGTMTGYRYARRRAAGDGWDSLPFTPMYGDRLTSVISTGEDEFLAAGFTGGSSSTARFMEWRGSMWAPVPPANQPPSVLATVVDAVAATDREVFLVGAASSGGYAIIRGRR